MFSLKKKSKFKTISQLHFSEILKFGLDNVSFHLFWFPQNGILLKTFKLLGPLAICCAHNAYCIKLLLPLNLVVVLLVKFKSSVLICSLTIVLLV